jgi:excisionase family DNA binding protein
MAGQYETPLLLSIPKAAELLSISADHCAGLIKAGRLPSIRLGRRVLVPVDELQAAIRWDQEQQRDGVIPFHTEAQRRRRAP